MKRDLERLRKIYFVKIQQVGRVADPDFIMTVNGWSVAIELKRSDQDQAKTNQAWQLLRAQTAGTFSFVANPENWDSVHDFLKMLCENPPSNLGEIQSVYRKVIDPT